ncbi:MAG TPA: DUF6484 domain-containing protein [Steroidobacteraceae bacterium]|nr:DUF6484 domain-containing protein [Steroidobacteraceae bacterium]
MSAVETKVAEHCGEDPAAVDVMPGARAPQPATHPAPAMTGSVVGTLIGFRDDGRVPLVLFPGQPGSAALAAATTIDVHGVHIGRQVVLVFEGADPRRPIIVGILRSARAWTLPEQPAEVEVDADGERLIVTAKEQLVLRCGAASITLTKDGKVLIQGAYVSNRSSGVMRIKGGSVQIN